MNPNFTRGSLLFEQGRHELAENEFRQSLAANPEDAQAHAMLALCLSELKQFERATEAAQRAAHLAPDEPFPHYALGRVFYDRNRFDEALSAINEAIRIDPTDPDYHSLAAGIHFDQKRWQESLGAAEKGLEYDAEHIGCNNLRAMALVKLNRPAEAGATIQATLARNPENSVTQANQGWACLEGGEREKALEHFREALRLDPENEWARAGIVEALKAGNPIYAVMLKYFLFMAKLSSGTQWAIIIGGYIGNRMLASLARSNPDWAPWVLPVRIAYIAFAVLTWTAYPMFNLMLRLNRFGRLALTPEQTVESNWIGGVFFLGLASLLWCLATGFNNPFGIMALTVFGLLLLPLAGLFRCSEGWPRRTMLAVVVGLALVGLAAMWMLWQSYVGDDRYLKAKAESAFEVLGLFSLGILASTFLGNYLASQRPRH